jgi:hypothetical protein
VNRAGGLSSALSLTPALPLNPCRRLVVAVRGQEQFEGVSTPLPATRRLQVAGTGSGAEIAALGPWILSLLALVIGLSAAACRKKAPVPPAEVLDEKAPDRLPTAPDDSSLRLPIHQELTSAVHLFQTDYRKLPPDFETLVKMKYLPALPKPPTGKRFALDRKRTQVVIMD